MQYLNAYNTTIGNFQVTFDLTNYTSQLPRFNLGTINARTRLTPDQFGQLNFLVSRPTAEVKLSFGKLVWKFPDLNLVDKVKFDLNYQNPEGDLRTIASFYQIPSTVLSPLYLEAQKRKGDKRWLKEAATWLAKNWQKLAGAITAAGILADVLSKSDESSDSNTSTLPEVETENGDINPGTGKPYGDAATVPGIGSQILTFAKENAVVLAGIGIGAYLLFPGKKKGKKRR